MSLNVSILVDEQDVQTVTDYLGAVGRRTARTELIPILLEALQPLVASEKSFLADHSESGALAASLEARAGSGDRPGTVSVFSHPSAKSSVLKKTWGTGRAQQKRWAANLEGKGRRAVFYGPILHQGHRVVKRNAAGQLYDTGKVVAPVPFAAQAVDALGDQQAEVAANAILDKIMGG